MDFRISAGVFFSSTVDKKSGRLHYYGQVIPTRGAWIEFEMGSKDIWYAKLDRSKKIPLTTFLRAMGLNSNREITNLFGNSQFLMNTFEKDDTFGTDDALEELYDKLMKVDYLKEYLTTKQTEIDQYNKERNIDTTVALNGRRLTNLGVYRIYLTEYLKNHPHIHPEMWRIVRQLQTTNKGVPLEVYAFSSKTSWGDYEAIMADIFDHIYATTTYFELKIYQEPSGDDIIQRINKS